MDYINNYKNFNENVKTHETYEEWFDIFVEVCRQLGYDGPLMSDTWEYDWENGADPFDEAKKFVEEINS